MNNKLLVCHGEGIGNAIQIAPLLRTLSEVGYKMDYWHVFGSYSISNDLFPYVNKTFIAQEISMGNFTDYFGMVSTIWAKNFIKHLPLKLLTSIKSLTITRSEVDLYMDIARELGISEDNLLWEASCNYDVMPEKFDIVISNGYNRKGDPVWVNKSYLHYKDVVYGLKNKGYTIASIGSKSEYIEGTEDRTMLPIKESLGLIKNAKLFIGNDSGMYHCANAVGTHNIALFTFTSTIKNYDSRFHKHCTIIRNNTLDCLDCQNTPRFKTCKSRICRDIDPNIIIKKAEELLCKI